MMTMLPVNQITASLPEASPSASSFKKLPAKEEQTENHVQQSTRKGPFELPRRSRHKTKEAVNSAPATTEALSSNKKVSFARTAKVKKVRSRLHYTEEEQNGMWYSADEYTSIKKGCVQTLRLMMSTPNFQDDTHHSSRGLESRTKEAAKKRKEFKMYSRELVLEEQENQREAGVHSPGRLRNVYQEMSTIALRQAREFALRDERERITEPLSYVIKVIKFEYGMR